MLIPTKTIEKDLGTVNATVSFTTIAPVTGKVSAIVIADAAAIATSDSNNWKFACVNKSNSSAAVLDAGADNGTAATGGSAISAYTSRSLALNATSANQNVNLGDVLEFTATMTGSPTAMSEFTVRFDYSFTSGDLFVVQVQKSGGVDAPQARIAAAYTTADGSTAFPSTVYPNYVYNVTDILGNSLGADMTPTKPRRPISTIGGGGLGTGYYDQNGIFQLYDANERPKDFTA